jgi:replicative DNA helicase
LGGKIPGVPSGLAKLDHLLGGWHDGDLTILGARPAMGKTAMLVKFMLAAGVSCGVISAEQPAQQLGARAMSAHSHVDASRFRSGAFEDEDIGRLMRAVSELVEHPCLIYDRSAPSIADVVRMARKWRHNSGIRVLFVDYVQRIEASNADKRTPKHERVGEVVRGLKSLARDLEIPVVALAQVNRDVEKRADKRPNMGDLADSSEIEKEADAVLTLYREAVYFDKGGVNERNQPVRPHVAEINVEKNRHGPCGYVECIWIPESMRFENMGNDDA